MCLYGCYAPATLANLNSCSNDLSSVSGESLPKELEANPALEKLFLSQLR